MLTNQNNHKIEISNNNNKAKLLIIKEKKNIQILL